MNRYLHTPRLRQRTPCHPKNNRLLVRALHRVIAAHVQTFARHMTDEQLAAAANDWERLVAVNRWEPLLSRYAQPAPREVRAWSSPPKI